MYIEKSSSLILIAITKQELYVFNLLDSEMMNVSDYACFKIGYFPFSVFFTIPYIGM